MVFPFSYKILKTANYIDSFDFTELPHLETIILLCVLLIVRAFANKQLEKKLCVEYCAFLQMVSKKRAKGAGRIQMLMNDGD